MKDNEIDREQMMVNDLVTVFTNQFSEVLAVAPEGYVNENRLSDTVDNIRGVLTQHLGEGPYTVDTVRQLNCLHEQAVTNDTGYSLSYMPTRNEFAIQTINPALEQTETKSDSLYAVVMGARKAMLGGE